jgi:hypothetical protein
MLRRHRDVVHEQHARLRRLIDAERAAQVRRAAISALL